MTVRLAGTAIICILAAFGAAFLVSRAVHHDTPARAATPPPAMPVADTVTHASASHKINVELVSEFAPVKASLKPKPKPKPKKHKPKPPVSVTPAAPSTVSSTPTYTAPAYTAPTYTPPPASTSPAPTHHKKSGGSSGGSGTTTIGGG